MILRDILPEAHRHLLPAVFDEDVPEESFATCHTCAMVNPNALPGQTPEGFFRPDVKCCSYHPNLPNFLVGSILSDDRPDMAEGRDRLRARIAAQTGVGPVWLAAPRKYTLLFLASRKTSFGRSLLLRCPYFSPTSTHCSIWRHRDSVCTTFFCKYSSGPAGEAAWRAIESTLRLVERRLAEYAARVLGAEIPSTPAEFDALTLEELEDRPNLEKHAVMWGEWNGREETYYRATREIVAQLHRDDFERILGDDELTSAAEKAKSLIARVRQGP